MAVGRRGIWGLSAKAKVPLEIRPRARCRIRGMIPRFQPPLTSCRAFSTHASSVFSGMFALVAMPAASSSDS